MFQISPTIKYAGFTIGGDTKPRCNTHNPVDVWTSQYNFWFPPALSIHNDVEYIQENMRCRLIHDVPRPYSSLYLMLSQYNPWLDCEMTREKRAFLKPRAGEMCYPVLYSSNEFFHNETVTDIVNLYLWPLLYSRAADVVACKTFGEWRRLFSQTISLAFPEYDYWMSVSTASASVYSSIADQRRTAQLMKYMTPARVLFLITIRANFWPYGPPSSSSSSLSSSSLSTSTSRPWRHYGLCSIKPKIKEYTDKTEIDWLVSADFLRKMKRVHMYFTNNASFSDSSSSCCFVDWENE
jgi:hypothetical protein